MSVLKILYATSDRIGSVLQLNNFLTIAGNKYDIKIAGYSGYNYLKPIDWTLDALLDFKYSPTIKLKGVLIDIYCEQIKYFNPDIIISDMEIFTSVLAKKLKIKLWQVSSSILKYSVDSKRNKIKYYSNLFDTETSENINEIFMMKNSDNNFIYSHFGDIDNPPKLRNNFTWIRPYHIVGENSIPCQHKIVASIFNNKKDIYMLQQNNDTIVFTDFLEEQFNNITLKDYHNLKEYACNLKNCDYYVHQGYTDFTANAFYNNKFSHFIPNYFDKECVANVAISEYYKLGKTINSLDKLENKEVKEMKYNNEIKYLHEKVEEL